MDAVPPNIWMVRFVFFHSITSSRSSRTNSRIISRHWMRHFPYAMQFTLCTFSDHTIPQHHARWQILEVKIFAKYIIRR
jgi:hypothetical protein